MSGEGNQGYTMCPQDSNFLRTKVWASYASLREFENDLLTTSYLLYNFAVITYGYL